MERRELESALDIDFEFSARSESKGGGPNWEPIVNNRV